MEKEKDINEVKETFAQRLQMTRKMRGFSVADLSKRLAGAASTTAIEKYEKGAMFPQSSSTIVALAAALQVPVGDLLRPVTLKFDVEGFSFRKKAKLSKKAQEAILLNIHQYVEKYFEIENIANVSSHYDLGRTSYIVDSAEKARQAAMDVRREWGLGNTPVAIPILLLEEHGVKIIEVDEDPTLFDGSSNTIGGTPVIVLNTHVTDPSRPEEERRRLTAFHEFGHQYMTIDASLDDKTKEDLCNIFASEMLIPSSVFIGLVGEKRKSIYPVELRNIQQVYGISCRALMMKARQLDVISENAYKWFCISLNKNANLKAFIDTCLFAQSHTSRFEQLVIRMLATDAISMGKAAELLGTTVGELSNKLNIA